MLEVSVNINREITVAQLHAVRKLPKSKTVKEGTVCTYDIIYLGTTVGNMKGKYGCGVDLAIQLLKKFKENHHLYKTLATVKLIEKGIK